jgi:hypothetical protein
VQYEPDFETLDETRDKLLDRIKTIEEKTKPRPKK